jgi:hypothetical protein
MLHRRKFWVRVTYVLKERGKKGGDGDTLMRYGASARRHDADRSRLLTTEL